MTERSLADLRTDYAQHTLDEAMTGDDPLRFFAQWFDQACECKVNEPNAMTLATIDPDGSPSARIVLLKAIDARGLTFFTNRQSRKGRALAHDPRASLVFFWPELERQVRIAGLTEWVEDFDSDSYFATRPRESQLGAWASMQSSVATSREHLDASMHEVTARFDGQIVPRPPHWGGYRLSPTAFEFWQGRRSRMHDRVHFARALGETDWRKERLFP
ncbi:MAG: pyridoxamine 5'-phosphate oxidase [Deltaproteobacteria bacterium]|nr:pyridoxamine 5'-phosphate oxidase [Deltaproteobacteria bacterium]